MYRFRLFSQKIENMSDNLEKSYELLLRHESRDVFPVKEFGNIVSDHSKHENFIIWFTDSILSILEAYPDINISFNLDHQELEYDETYVRLRKLLKFKSRITIEITETLPISRKTDYFSDINILAFKKLKSMGFKIALDDVGQGINSLGNMLRLLDIVDRVKFSTLNFRYIGDLNVQVFLSMIAKITSKAGKELVVEGIEEAQFSSWVGENITQLQQGFLYSVPKIIWPREHEGVLVKK